MNQTLTHHLDFLYIQFTCIQSENSERGARSLKTQQCSIFKTIDDEF